MKNILGIATGVMIATLVSCAGQRTTNADTPASDSTNTTDTVNKELTYKELLGKWDVVNMRRTANAEPEAVSDVFITLADSSFGGKAPCNHISGSYSRQDDKIHFGQIISTKMACERSEQESAFLALLENKVSAYLITADSLLLKDESAHTILACKKSG